MLNSVVLFYYKQKFVKKCIDLYCLLWYIILSLYVCQTGRLNEPVLERAEGKMKSTTKDLTKGNPTKLILGFAIPMLLGLLFQQFYSMSDAIIVGKWLGVTSLAAVGSTGSINFMVIGFCTGVCSGFAIPVSRCFGAGNHTDMRRYVANIIRVGIVMAAIITVTVSLLCRSILVLMRTPDDIINEAYSYIFIIFLGIPVTFLYNMAAGLIRALGDSKTPLYFLLLSAGLNIVLDIISVGVLGLGIMGPAIATVISQAISGITCLIFMIKKFPILHVGKEERPLSWHHIKILLSSGLPMGLQYSITAIGTVILQTSVNTLGSLYVASVTAAGRVNMFFCCVFDSLGGTMATYSSQNIGAEKPERITSGLKSALIIGASYCVIAALILCFFGKYIALLFMDPGETEILNNVQKFLTANSLSYVLLLGINVFRFSIQGIGYSSLAVFAGVAEMIARCIMGFVLVPIFAYNAVCFANPLAWLFADLFLVPTYIICLKKVKSKFLKKPST